TFSDTEGRYRMTGVPEGRVVVTANLGDGFLSGTASATLAGGGATLDLDVALHDSGQVVGRVVQADGVAGAPTSVVTIQVGGAGGGSFSTTTDANGRFGFDRIPAGLVTLTASVLGSIDQGRAAAEVPAAGTLDLTIQLHGLGQVKGRAIDSTGQPLI